MQRRLLLLPLLSLPLAFAFACSSSDDAASDVDTAPIAWVSPTVDAEIDVDDAVELTVKVNDPNAQVVRFDVNGTTIDTCDTSQAADECHHGDLFRTTTTFKTAGLQHLVARLGDQVATLDVTVRAATSPTDPSDASADDAETGSGPTKKDGGTTTPPTNRGFLDPNRASHNVFGGVSWTVNDAVVGVTAAPSGSTSAVSSCMKTYGASIIKWADTYKISRASVVATAITESSCTNPTGSSDGLSSGPLQVTGSTCASLVSGYSSASCKAKMHSSPDFSFQVGSKYMGSSYQLGQSSHDPPKIGAAYNAGSIRSSTANRWHMVVTGNHIERWVGAYNAYRAWEKLPAAQQAKQESESVAASEKLFAGEHVATPASLPSIAIANQVYFVGNWETRDGKFVRYADGAWQDE